MSTKRRHAREKEGTAMGTTLTNPDVDRGAALDRAALAAFLGYAGPGTVTKLLGRARKRRAAGETARLFPEPDGYIGRTPFWYEDTAAKYGDEKLWQGQSRPPENLVENKVDEQTGLGDCPVCGQAFQSVSSHRNRKAECSFDSKVRDEAWQKKAASQKK